MKRLLTILFMGVISAFMIVGCITKEEVVQYIDYNKDNVISEWEKPFVRSGNSSDSMSKVNHTISTFEELRNISTTGNTENDYYKLNNNIDCNGAQFKAINLGKATLYGNNYCIYNFQLKATRNVYPDVDTSTDKKIKKPRVMSYTSLFANGSKVQDLNIHIGKLDLKKGIVAKDVETDIINDGNYYGSFSLFCATKSIDNVNIRGIFNLLRPQMSKDGTIGGFISSAIFSAGYTVLDTSITTGDISTKSYKINTTENITNCSFEGEYNFTEYSSIAIDQENAQINIIGGVIDINEFKGVISNVSIISKTNILTKSRTTIGGIAGINYGVIFGCTTKGEINTNFNLQEQAVISVGGIVGASLVGDNQSIMGLGYDDILKSRISENLGQSEVRYCKTFLAINVNGELYNIESKFDSVCGEFYVGGLIGQVEGGFNEKNITSGDINIKSVNKVFAGGFYGISLKNSNKHNISRVTITADHIAKNRNNEDSGEGYISTFAGIFNNGFYEDCISKGNITITNSTKAWVGVFGQARSLKTPSQMAINTSFPTLSTITNIGDIIAHTGESRINQCDLTLIKEVDKIKNSFELGSPHLLKYINIKGNISCTNHEKKYDDDLINSNTNFTSQYHINSNDLLYDDKEYIYNTNIFDLNKISFKQSLFSSQYTQKYTYGADGEKIDFTIGIPKDYNEADTSENAKSIYTELGSIIGYAVKEQKEIVNITLEKTFIEKILTLFGLDKGKFDAAGKLTPSSPVGGEGSIPLTGTNKYTLDATNLDKYLFAFKDKIVGPEEYNQIFIQYLFVHAINLYKFDNVNIFDFTTEGDLNNSIYTSVENLSTDKDSMEMAKYDTRVKNKFTPKTKNSNGIFENLYTMIINSENFNISDISDPTVQDGNSKTEINYKCTLTLLFNYNKI